MPTDDGNFLLVLGTIETSQWNISDVCKILEKMSTLYIFEGTLLLFSHLSISAVESQLLAALFYHFCGLDGNIIWKNVHKLIKHRMRPSYPVQPITNCDVCWLRHKLLTPWSTACHPSEPSCWEFHLSQCQCRNICSKSIPHYQHNSGQLKQSM